MKEVVSCIVQCGTHSGLVLVSTPKSLDLILVLIHSGLSLGGLGNTDTEPKVTNVINTFEMFF